MHRHNTLLKALGFISILLVSALLSSAQQAGGGTTGTLQTTFLKDSIELDGKGFQFNNLSLKGAQAYHIGVKTAAPSFINQLTPAASTLELTKDEEEFIPIRFSVSASDEQSTRWTPYTLSLIIKETGETVTKTFWVRVKPQYKWKLALNNPEQALTGTNSRTTAQVILENTGNTADAYKITCKYGADLEVKVPSSKLSLKPGEQKTVSLEVILKPYQPQTSADIIITVENSTGEKRAVVQKLTIIGHTFNQHIEKWQRIPLALELNAQSIRSGQTFYYGALRGNLALGKNQNLDVQLLSNYYSKEYTSKSQTGYIRYTSEKNTIKLGAVENFNYFALTGMGATLEHLTKGKGRITLSGMQGRYMNVVHFNGSFYQPLSPKLEFTTSDYINMDKDRLTKSYLSVNKLQWNFNKQASLGVEVGGGIDNQTRLKWGTDTTLYGRMAGYEFRFQKGKWGINSRVRTFSKNFPGINKGFQYHLHEVAKTIGKTNLSLYYTADKRIYTQFMDTLFQSFQLANNKEYGARTSFPIGKVSMNLSLGMLKQQQDSSNSLTSNTAFASLGTTWSRHNLLFQVNSSLGYVSIPSRPDIKPFMAFSSFANIKVKYAGLYMKYDYNPYYYFEIKRFVEEGSPFRRIYIAPFVEKEFARLHLSYRGQYNYSQDKAYDYTYSTLSNQLTWSMQRAGIDLGVYHNLNLNDKQYSSVNVTLRKSLGLPAYKKGKSYDFSVTLYKDLNHDNIYNDSDVLIRDADILIDGLWYRTNDKGSLEFRNTGANVVNIDFSKIRGLNGWMPKEGIRQAINPNTVQKKLFISFKESKTITGKVLLFTDEKSEKRMLLNNIRVTAVDESGVSYSTLTDASNEFFFNLPAGKYTVTINPDAFDEEFRPVEFTKEADLRNQNSASVIFQVQQKKRTIHIKKVNGEEEEEE